MNKKSIIILICVALVLMGLIAGGVMTLYSDKPESGSAQNVQQPSTVLLKAVPSDAAAVLCFSDLSKATSFLVDPQQMFSPVFARTASAPFKSFVSDLQASDRIRTSDVVLSYHYSGSMEPLLIVDGGHAVSDTLDRLSAIESFASQKGLETAVTQLSGRQILLISTTSTLVSSAVRHIESRTSILDNKQFAAAAAAMPGTNVIFASNIYAPRLVGGFFAKQFRKYSDFLKGYADWTAFHIGSAGDYALALHSEAFCGRGNAYFYNMLTSLKTGESHLGGILPAGTTFALGAVTADRKSYEDAFRKYLDANAMLQKRQSRCDDLKRAKGVTPAQWAADAAVCEVATVSWTVVEDQFSVVLVRGTAVSKDEPAVKPYERGGFAAAQFGSVFSVPEENFCAQMGEWTVSGSEAAVTEFISAVRFEEAPFVGKECSFVGYIAPVALEANRSGISLEARRIKRAVAATAGSAIVDVPKGPFKVTNSGTGRKNLFSQSANLSLTLKEESGKALWSVPFDQPLAGCVNEVDNFKNGKIQFLFAAGQKLYLIDRLGRFCSGFPVDLGKKVALGPAIYDFSGSRIYSAVVLHDDNTIEMYNLKGQKPASWKTITSPDSILGLPELKTVEGKKYWAVKTTAGVLAFDFNGGEPLKGKAARNVLSE